MAKNQQIEVAKIQTQKQHRKKLSKLGLEN